MILTTGRLLEHWHTGAMTRRASVLDAIEPEAVALLSPRELRPAGLWARRSRPRHHPPRLDRAGVRADRDVPEGVIFIPFCFAEAAANLLTNPAPRSLRQDPRVQVLRGEAGGSLMNIFQDLKRRPGSVRGPRVLGRRVPPAGIGSSDDRDVIIRNPSLTM